MSPLLTRSMCRLAKVANAGVHLEGKDAAKFESLRARMANEQQDYLKVLRTKAFADHARYTSCHALAAQQIEVLSIQDACSTWQHLSLLCLTPGGLCHVHISIRGGLFAWESQHASTLLCVPSVVVPKHDLVS